MGFVIGAVSLLEIWNRKWTEAPPGTPIFDEFRHGVVVAERRWFEANRHTYPYSHWRMYDTLTEYSLKEWVATRDKPAQEFNPVRESKARR